MYATTLRTTYTYGGDCEELIVASACLSYDIDETPSPKEGRDITDYRHSRKNNSSFGMMPKHTTYFGGALSPIQEKKASWNFW
jgi:hypothetical protein